MSKTSIFIKKINEQKSCIFYAVSRPFQDVEFYIAIDKQNATISFFMPSDIDKPVGIINTKSLDNLTEIPGIDIKISNPVIINATKALLNNKFPDDISWLP